MQSKTQSMIESFVIVGVGYGVALLSQFVIFPRFGISVTLSDNLWICGWFTVISLIRSYALRRIFNIVHHAEGRR